MTVVHEKHFTYGMFICTIYMVQCRHMSIWVSFRPYTNHSASNQKMFNIKYLQNPITYTRGLYVFVYQYLIL